MATCSQVRFSRPPISQKRICPLTWKLPADRHSRKLVPAPNRAFSATPESSRCSRLAPRRASSITAPVARNAPRMEATGTVQIAWARRPPQQEAPRASTATAPSAPPELTPSRPGLARGLRKKACMTTPEAPSPAPTAMPTRVRGRRISQRMVEARSSDRCRRARSTSERCRFESPRASEAIAATTSSSASAARGIGVRERKPRFIGSARGAGPGPATRRHPAGLGWWRPSVHRGSPPCVPA